MNQIATVSALTFGAQAFVTLFVILDPPGATPIFLGLVAGESDRRKRRMAWQGAFISFSVIVSFAIFGNALLNYLNISFASLQGAGGLLLLITALGLLTGYAPEEKAGVSKNVALVPLGTPLLAGPGAIVTTMLFVRDANDWGQISALFIAIVAVHIVIGLTLMFSTKILAVIKDAGVDLVAKIAGLLLAAIAVEMIVASIKAYFL
ncbi:MAG: NAAT family transporter [Actinobacteria bacterium]|nr:NAAT family transporter [Actinomycetota bacterium]